MAVENTYFQLFMQIQMFTLKSLYRLEVYMHLKRKYKNLSRIKSVFVFICFHPESILILKTLV